MRDLHDAVEMDEQESADGQGAGGGERAGGGSAPMRGLAAVNERDDLANWNLPQQIAEKDEEKKGPQEGNEAVGVFFERRTDHFDAEKLQDRFEKVSRPGWGVYLCTGFGFGE